MPRPKKPKSNRQEVCINYIKSPFFRVVHADGVIGGPAPTLDIHMTFFSQRIPIPQVQYFPVNEDGTLGQEITSRTEKRSGIVREGEVDVIMTVAAAQTLVDWLNQKIQEIRTIRETHPPRLPEQSAKTRGKDTKHG